MTASQINREPLNPLELERLFDSLDSEGKEILTNQMMLLHNLTNRLQQLHTELLKRIDRGEKVEADDFGGLCISCSEPQKGETWSQGIGAVEPVCNAFIGTFHTAWKSLPEEVFETMIELAKKSEELRVEGQEQDDESQSSPIIDLAKWKVDNKWKN